MYSLFSKKLIILFLLLLSVNYSFSQRRNNKKEYETDTLHNNLPEKYLNYPAVFIYEKRKIIIAPNVTNEVNKVRIKILSKEGIDMFSVIQRIKTKKQTLRKLKGRTLKKDGRIIPLNIQDIKYTDIDVNTGAKPNFEIMKFIIPNVEVGDEIEYSIEMQTPDIIPGIDIIMYNRIPNLYAEFVLETRDKCEINFLLRNGMPDGARVNEFNNWKYTWKEYDLPALLFEEPYSFIYNEIPYLSIAVREGIKDNEKAQINPKSWDGIYRKIKKDNSNEFFNKSYNNSNIDAWLDSIILKNKTNSKVKIIEETVQYIYDSLEIVSDYPSYKSVPGYQYIVEKKIDNKNYFNIIDLLFQKLKINYFLGCASNKYEGFISLNFPSLHNVTNTFFLFESEDNQLHYVHLPVYNSSFRFDELPYTILGVRSLIIKEIKGSADKTSYQFLEFTIPESKYFENTRQTHVTINHSFKKQQSNIKVSEKFIGDFSTLYDRLLNYVVNKNQSKKEFISLWNKNINTLDSLSYINTTKSFPYTSLLNYTYSKSDLINSIDNNSYSINIAEIIDHYSIYTTSYERQFQLALPFPYKDEFIIEIVFDKPIQIESKLNNRETDYNHMDYYLTVEKKSAKSIIIKSAYLLEKTIYNASANIMIHKLNENYNTAINNKIIISSITTTPQKKGK